MKKSSRLFVCALLAGTSAGGSSAFAATCVVPPAIAPAAQLFASANGAAGSILSVLNTLNIYAMSQGTSFVGFPNSQAPDDQGGGVWTRGIAGDGKARTSININITAPFGALGACQATTQQSYQGFQVGADLARVNFNGGAGKLAFGITGGVLQSRAKDVGGVFTGNFNAPFFGVYGAYANGGFFADGLVRIDHYQSEISDPANQIVGQKFNARGVSLTGNLGYRFNFADNWFIEPSVGGTFSRLTIDTIGYSGTNITPTLFPVVPGSIRIAPIQSLLGRASVRVATNVLVGQLALQPFVTLSVFREFSGNTQASFDGHAGLNPAPGLLVSGSNPPGGPVLPPAVSATFNASRVGTFGQIGVGVAGQVLNTGWVGFGRFDYRFGANLNGWAVSTGLRYQFSPDGRQAGIIRKGDPVSAPAPVNWSGFYIGGLAGSVFGASQKWTYANGNTTSPGFAGAHGGVTAGYNFQSGNAVYGVEADIVASNADGGKGCPNNFQFTCNAHLNWLSTITGRAGVTWNRALIYAKGGLAIGEARARTSFNLGGNPLLFGFAPGAVVASASQVRTGWTLGTGFEFALSKNWSTKAEYMYFDLGSSQFALDQNVRIGTRGSLSRIGVNYRFN